MKSIFEFIISMSILVGASRYVLIKTHDFVRDLAVSKIRQGLFSTQDLNRKLWEGVE